MASATRGWVLHDAAWYDLRVWVMTRGRERAMRARWLDLARVAAGDAVLDLGCGTGTLAIAAAARVGAGGAVTGIDPSPEMIARARAKARRAGVAVAFEEAAAESLPFADARFDVVLSTVMLHHVAREERSRCLAEVRRVLRAGGRLLVVDFVVPPVRGHGHGRGHGLLHQLLHRGHGHGHGHGEAEDLGEVVSAAGFRVVERGPAGMRGLEYVIGEG